MGRSGKMRRRAGRRFLAITSEGKFTIIETTTAACEFRMQVCLRHSSSTTLLLAKTLFFPPFILHPSRLSFPFPCQRDLSSARATTPPPPFLSSLFLADPSSSLDLPSSSSSFHSSWTQTTSAANQEERLS